MSQNTISKNKDEKVLTSKSKPISNKKSSFQKDFDEALTLEEARALSLKHVHSLWKK